MKTYRCQYCGQAYKYPKMALRCQKTRVCKMFNAPNSTLRQEWEIQAGTVTMALFFTKPMTDQFEGEPREKAAAIVETCELLCDYLRETYPVGKQIAEMQGKRITQAAGKIWGFGASTMVVHLCEVVANLIGDVLDRHAQRWAAGTDTKGKELWMRLDRQMEALYDCMNPEGVECDESWRTYPAYDELHVAIWGPEKAEKQPKVYLANERIWVVAFGKPEARRCLLNELGLSRPALRGMDLGTALENGGNVRDLIPLATKIPAIVARTTA